ncbi:MAG TPA: polymer-forming cytoskeletal protein [Gemmatimonadaceae bacterium]|nr:polymer-forming cytoskeletal protein [Gemmatimonadaceae bacterium]
MALWKEQSPVSKDTVPPLTTEVSPPPRVVEPRPEPAPSPSHTPTPRTAERVKESLIAEELTIEGKIEGAGHVRIAGRFKGDINVQGNLSIEPGATLTGAVRAQTITIGGHLEGNIDSASRVELLATGVLDGDLSAESITVAAGSRMRGKVEFGWPKGAQAGAKPSPIQPKTETRIPA